MSKDSIIDLMVRAYEEEKNKYFGNLIHYPSNDVAFREAMKKAVRILDDTRTA